MRVLLTANASYAPPKGGSTRSNLLWLEHLARAGHACRVVCPTLEGAPAAETMRNGISICSAPGLSHHVRVLGDEIRAFQPDWVLVSSEDVSHVLLREAGHAAPGRLVYLAHTPQFFPFGPESWSADASATRIVREARAVVAIGRHMAGYIERHLGRPAEVIHPPIYGTAPYPRFGDRERGWILMINPCAVKGISIFEELAGRFPQRTFAALSGWGTTRRDAERLGRLANVRLLETVPSIDEVLSHAALLLMPSLWYEGFGLIAMEAMLRGLPVVASDSGGLKEAKEGTGWIIPVKPVTRYEPVFDETHMPRAVVEEQSLEPWVEAVRTLLENREEWEAESERSRQAGLRFTARLDASDFEKMLSALAPSADALVDPSPGGGSRFEQLDPARRALLVKLLRERRSHS